MSNKGTEKAAGAEETDGNADSRKRAHRAASVRHCADSQPAASKPTLWAARIAVAVVFVVNVQCAVQFVVWPDAFAPAYELSGFAGSVAVQGLGVAFLMWNATYPLVIVNPAGHRTLYGIVLVQQIIGLTGESAILASIPEGHALLAASIARFVAFDGAGLVFMAVAFAALTRSLRHSAREVPSSRADRHL